MADLQHVLRPSDLSDADRQFVLARARALKTADPDPPTNRLRVGALYFNPSLRTRASFEQAVRIIGGSCQTLNAAGDTWGLELDPDAVMDGDRVENLVEAARVLGRYFHILGVRSFRGSDPWAIERTEPVLERVARHAGVPVISLEGATHHPCQSLADHLTLLEQFGNVKGLPVTLSWAWHPKQLPAAVPHSFLLQAGLAGCDVTVAHPPGFELDEGIVAQATTAAKARGGDVRISHDRPSAYAGSRVVYVKSWGQLHASGATDPALRSDWLVDEASLAGTDDAKVMHCLPVRRNVVIAGEVLEGPRSIVVDQAENRLWVQAALVEFLARQQGVIS